MTRTIKLIGLLMIVALATTGCHYVCRNIRGMMYHSRMERHSRAMEFSNMRRSDREEMRPDDKFRSEGQGHWMSGNRWRGGMPGMRDGMGRGPAYGIGRGMGPAGFGQMDRNNMRIDRIPNLTDTQRKEINELRQKQMQEIDKLREETFAKMQSLKEENRTKMMSLLTDEQKKFLEAGPPAARQDAPQSAK